MDDDERHRNEWEADGYRAIGRWWVQFSRLIGGMRSTMETRLRQDDDSHELPTLAFSGATSGQIVEAFFGMARLVSNLDEAEENIANRLQDEVVKANQLRNKLAHGDWMIGKGPEHGEDPSVHAYLIRFYAKAPHHRVEYLTARQLDVKSDRLLVLMRMVYRFGEITLGKIILTTRGIAPAGTYRVSDVLIAENVPKNGKGGQVKLDGPRASELI